MIDCSDIKRRLDEAQDALHRVNTTGIVRAVTDSDGSSISYSQIDSSKLVSYIALLTAQYAACIAGQSVTTVVTRPVSFLF